MREFGDVLYECILAVIVNQKSDSCRVSSSPNFCGAGRWRTRTGHQNHRPINAAIDGVMNDPANSTASLGRSCAPVVGRVRHTRLRSPLRVVCTYSISMARGGGAVSDLAHLPRGLLSLEQWDALELDPTRRWELNEGTLIMSPRPDLWHQRISKRLTRLLDDHLPDELEAVPEIEVITRASFPPSVRDPDIVVVPDRVFERRPTRVSAADVVLVVEIVSPGSRGTDHVMKLHEYAKAGIANYWIVDPDAPADERFLAYRLDAGTYRRVAALEGDWVRVNEPTALEFALDVLTGR